MYFHPWGKVLRLYATDITILMWDVLTNGNIFTTVILSWFSLGRDVPKTKKQAPGRLADWPNDTDDFNRTPLQFAKILLVTLTAQPFYYPSTTLYSGMAFHRFPLK